MTGKRSGPEGRNSAKIEPKKCVTSLLKQGTIGKKHLLPAFVITVLSRPVALTSAATARLMASTRNAETPPNFVPKTRQNRAQKVPNVPSETLEKQYSFGQGFIKTT